MKYKPSLKVLLFSHAIAMVMVLAALVIGPSNPMGCACQVCAPDVSEATPDNNDHDPCCAHERVEENLAKLVLDGGDCKYCNCGDPNHVPDVSFVNPTHLKQDVKIQLPAKPVPFIVPQQHEASFNWSANAPPVKWTPTVRTHLLLCVSLT